MPMRMCISCTIALALCWPAAAQESSPGMLRSWLQRIAAEQLAARKKEVAETRTREQFEARRAEVRKKILHMIGGLPEKRTSLNPRRMGAIERDGYRVEKIVFESQPRFFVTANLYVPRTGR